ncbi:MAG: hypothetical protein ACFB8W_00490 [Elainellaceae cyanobacterium]
MVTPQAVNQQWPGRNRLPILRHVGSKEQRDRLPPNYLETPFGDMID